MRTQLRILFTTAFLTAAAAFPGRSANNKAEDPNYLFLQELAKIQGNYWLAEFTATVQPYTLQFNALYEAENGLIHIANKISGIDELIKRNLGIAPRLKQVAGLANRYNLQLLQIYLSNVNSSRSNLSRLPKILPELFKSNDLLGSNIFTAALRDLAFRDKLKECRKWETNFNNGWSSLLDSIATIHPKTKNFASNPQITNPLAGLIRANPEYNNADGAGTNPDEAIDLGLIRDSRAIQISEADLPWQYFFRVRKTKEVSLQIRIKNVQGLVLAKVHNETILGKRYVQSETVKGYATPEREAVLDFGPGRMDFFVSVAHFYEPIYGELWKGSGASILITATGKNTNSSPQATTQSLKLDPYKVYISSENKRAKSDSLNRIYEIEIKNQITRRKVFAGYTYHSDAVPLSLELQLKGNSNEIEGTIKSPTGANKLEGKINGAKVVFPGYDLDFIPFGKRKKFAGLLPEGLGVRFFIDEPDTALIDLMTSFSAGNSLLLFSGKEYRFKKFCYLLTISVINKNTGEFSGFIDWPGGEKYNITGHIFDNRIMFYEGSPAYNFSSCLVASEDEEFINLNGTRSFTVERPEWGNFFANVLKKAPPLVDKLNPENSFAGKMSFGREVHPVTLSFSYDRLKNKMHGTLDVPNLGLTFIVDGAVERNLLVFTNTGFAQISKELEQMRKHNFWQILNRQSYALGYAISPDESREVLLGGWKLEKRKGKRPSDKDALMLSDKYSFSVIEPEKIVAGGYMELDFP